MKTKSKILALLGLFISLISYSQNPGICRDRNFNVSISTSCHSVCIPGTYKLDTAYCSSFVVNGTGGMSYTWASPTATVVNSSSVLIAPTVAGIVNYTVYGQSVFGIDTCNGQAVISVTAVVCANSYSNNNVAIPELNNSSNETKLYFDILGLPTELTPNKLITEIIITPSGIRSRKIIISD